MNSENYSVAMLARSMWHAGHLYTPEFDPTMAELAGYVIRNQVMLAAGQVGWLETLNTIPCNAGNEVRRADDPRFLKVLWRAESIYTLQAADKTDGAVIHTVHARQNEVSCLNYTLNNGLVVYFYKSPIPIISEQPQLQPDLGQLASPF